MSVLYKLTDLSPEVFEFLVSMVVKGILIFAIAGSLNILLRKASAALRHMVWLLAFGALSLLPLLILTVPSVGVPVLPAAEEIKNSELKIQREEIFSASQLEVFDSGFSFEGEASSGEIPQANIGPTNAEVTVIEPELSLSVGQWLLLAWAAGFVICLCPICYRLILLAIFQGRCRKLEDKNTVGLVEEVCGKLNIRKRVKVIGNDDASGRFAPMVWGVRPAVLFLPKANEGWDCQQLRSVLLHELAHIKRHDWLSQLFGSVVCAGYWFNPLVWYGLRRLRVEREQACDDLVINSGIDHADYAEHLVGIARRLVNRQPVNSAALAMARTSQIESRIKAILDIRKNRKAVTRVMLAGFTIVVAAVSVTLASLTPVEKETEKASEELMNPPKAEADLKQGSGVRDQVSGNVLADARLINIEEATTEDAKEDSKDVEKGTEILNSVQESEAGQLEVYVTYAADDSSIEGARMRLYLDKSYDDPIEILTDKDGIARVSLTPGVYELGTPMKDRYVSVFKSNPKIEIKENSRAQYEFQMTDAPRLIGYVHDSTGKPVANAVVRLIPEGPKEGYLTNENGKFEFSWRLRPITTYLVARNPLDNTAGVIQIHDGMGELKTDYVNDPENIILSEAQTVTGRVLNETGDVVAGARVEILKNTPRGLAMIASGITDRSGNYSINAIPPDVEGCWVRAEADRYGGPVCIQVKPPSAGNICQAESLTLKIPDSSISGVVADSEGNTIEGATVKTACGYDGQPERIVKTDSNGRFVIDGVCKGELSLFAKKGELGTFRVDTFGGKKDLKIVLTPQVAVFPGVKPLISGIAVTAKPVKTTWNVGEVPQVEVVVDIADEQVYQASKLSEIHFSHYYNAFMVIVDGREYVTDHSATAYPVSLMAPWKIKLPLDIWVIPRKTGDTLADVQQLKLTPGKHKVKIAFIGRDNYSVEKNFSGPDAFVMPVSEEFEIEIQPDIIDRAGFNNVKVGLVSICNKRTGLSYGLDGNVINKPGYFIEWPTGNSRPDFNRLPSSEVPANNYEYEKENNFDYYEVVVKIDGVKPVDKTWIKWEADKSGTLFSDRGLTGKGIEDNYYAARLRVPKGAKTTNINLGMNVRGWKILESFDEPGEYKTDNYYVKLEISDLDPRSRGFEIRCTHNIADHQVKLDLLDKKGIAHGQMQNIIWKVDDGLFMIRSTFDRKLKDIIKGYRVCIGDNDWFTLKDVKLPVEEDNETVASSTAVSSELDNDEGSKRVSEIEKDAKWYEVKVVDTEGRPAAGR